MEIITQNADVVRKSSRFERGTTQEDEDEEDDEAE